MAKTQKQDAAIVAATTGAVSAIRAEAVTKGNTSKALADVILALRKAKPKLAEFMLAVVVVFGNGEGGAAKLAGTVELGLGADYAKSGTGRNRLSVCRGVCAAIERPEVIAALGKGSLDNAYKVRNGIKPSNKGAPKVPGANTAGTPKAETGLGAKITRAEFIAREIKLDGGRALMLDIAAALRQNAQPVRATEVDAVAAKLAA